MDFPRLVTSLTPLTEAAGLQNLGMSADYCARYGWFYSVHAFRGEASVLLLHNERFESEADLERAVTGALLDQLAAYYATACQL